MAYSVGERVQVDFPRADDPDHKYHGETGEITDILEDVLSGITGDARHGYLYRVSFADEALGEISFRYDDLQLLDWQIFCISSRSFQVNRVYSQWRSYNFHFCRG